MDITSKSNWYDKAWLVIILIFFCFPVGFYGLYMSNTLSKNWKIGIVAIFITLGVIGQFLPKKENSDHSTDTKNIVKKEELTKEDLEKEEKEKAADKEKKLKEKIKEELNSEVFTKNFEDNTHRNSKDALILEVALFGAWYKIIGEGEKSKDEETKKLASELKVKVSNMQVKVFPQLRKAFIQILADKLWEDNIYVKADGYSNESIVFTGSLFANNKNIKQTQESLQEILNLLRFKQTRFYWSKYASEYTFYDMKTPNDSDPVEYENK